MSAFIEIHPQNPQPRLIKQVVEVIRAGGVIVYPTDSCYALGCQMGNKAAMDRIRTLRQLDDKHNMTLICRDLSEIATYAIVDNATFRLLKANTPGAYTFVLPATHEVPRRLQHPKRKTIGIRVPDHAITLAILEALGEPLVSSTLSLPPTDTHSKSNKDEETLMTDPEEMYERLQYHVDVVVNGGYCGNLPTTVVDFVNGVPVIARKGKGDVRPFVEQ